MARRIDDRVIALVRLEPDLRRINGTAGADRARRLASRLLEDAPSRAAVIPLIREGDPPLHLSLPLDLPSDAFAVSVDDDAIAGQASAVVPHEEGADTRPPVVNMP